jgi:hypothetical protein
MLSEVMVIVASPHWFEGFDTTSVGEPRGVGGTWFVTVTLSVSPGFT